MLFYLFILVGVDLFFLISEIDLFRKIWVV